MPAETIEEAAHLRPQRIGLEDVNALGALIARPYDGHAVRVFRPARTKMPAGKRSRLCEQHRSEVHRLEQSHARQQQALPLRERRGA